MPSVRISGYGPNPFVVAVEAIGNSICFTHGWHLFAQAERIVKGDQGLFILVAPNTFEFMLLDNNGAYKPMAARPDVWSVFVALGEEEDNPGSGGPDGGAIHGLGGMLFIFLFIVYMYCFVWTVFEESMLG